MNECALMRDDVIHHHVPPLISTIISALRRIGWEIRMEISHFPDTQDNESDDRINLILALENPNIYLTYIKSLSGNFTSY